MAAGIAVYRFGPKMFGWVEHVIAEETERQKLASDWQPPARDAGPDKLFPARIGEFELASHDDKAAIPEFKFDLPGRHAAYRSPQGQVDVFIYQVSELEREALLRRVDDAYESSKAGRRITKTPYRAYYSSPEFHQNHFWWMKGWLFAFRSRDEQDREPFVMAYLRGNKQ